MISSVVETAGLGGNMEYLKGQFDPLVTKHNNNAPSQGLVLWRANYDEYNARVQKNVEQGHSKEYKIDITDEIIAEMNKLQDSVVPQICQEYEVK